MKKITLFIHEPTINKVIGNQINLLFEEASLLDVINEVDKMLGSEKSFPVPSYHSLLHMIYYPVENRFYKQVALTGYRKSGQMVNVRDNPTKELPDEVSIVLVPTGGCISEWEEAMKYEEFVKALVRIGLQFSSALCR